MSVKEVNQRNEKGMKELKGEVCRPYWARGVLEDLLKLEALIKSS